jgi:hypothetical protein
MIESLVRITIVVGAGVVWLDVAGAAALVTAVN